MKEYFTGTDRMNEAHKFSYTERMPDGTDCQSGAMLSAYALRKRKSNPSVGRWMLDSGAFSQVTMFGDFIQSPAEYVRLAVSFQDAGDLACIATQDYMCEPSVIAKLQSQGRAASVRIHQKKTVERYIQIMDEGIKQGLKVPVMPVLQGWEVEDYVDHYLLYRRMLNEVSAERTSYGRTGIPKNNMWHHPFHHPITLGTPHLPEGQWVGIGSTCKRNTNPEVVAQILDALEEQTRSQWTRQPRGIVTTMKVHLFGFKKTGLKQSNIKDRIYSADSFAYDLDDRMSGAKRTTRKRIKSGKRFGKSIIHNNVQMGINLN